MVTLVAQVQGQQTINQISCVVAISAARDGTLSFEEGNEVDLRERMHLVSLSQNPKLSQVMHRIVYCGILPPRYGLHIVSIGLDEAFRAGRGSSPVDVSSA